MIKSILAGIGILASVYGLFWYCIFLTGPTRSKKAEVESVNHDFGNWDAPEHVVGKGLTYIQWHRCTNCGYAEFRRVQ